MANGTIIKLRHNTSTGVEPVTTDLILGELAINSFDGHLFLKKNNGGESIVNLTTDYVTYNTLNTNGEMGTTAGTVAHGDHNHTDVYEPVDENILRKADVVNSLTSSVTNVPLSAAMGKSLQDNKLAAADITYAFLDTTRSLVGTGASQVARGNHTHAEKLNILDAPVFTGNSVTSRSTNTELVLAGNGTAGVTVEDQLTINGSLTVTGTVTTINTTDLAIADNEITLNSDFVGATPEVIDTGITVNRGGTVLDTKFIWSESLDKWRLTEDGTNFYDILTDNDTSVTANNKIVLRDASGDFTANVITADLTGNADTASALASGITASVTGAVTGTSASWDGSGNLTIDTSLATHSHTSTDLPTNVVYDTDFGSEGVMYRNATSGSYGIKTIDDSQGGTNGNLNLITSNAVFDGLATKQNTLVFGIADTNAVRIDSGSIADGNFAKFTGTGLTSVSAATLISDLNLVATTDSIDVINDIDTTTVTPIINDVLTWDGTNWVPDATAATYNGWTVSDGTNSENVATNNTVQWSSTNSYMSVDYNPTTNIMGYTVNVGTTAGTVAQGNHTHTLSALTDTAVTLAGDSTDEDLILTYNATTDKWTSTHTLDGGTY